MIGEVRCSSKQTNRAHCSFCTNGVQYQYTSNTLPLDLYSSTVPGTINFVLGFCSAGTVR